MLIFLDLRLNLVAWEGLNFMWMEMACLQLLTGSINLYQWPANQGMVEPIFLMGQIQDAFNHVPKKAKLTAHMLLMEKEAGPCGIEGSSLFFLLKKKNV